MTQAASRRTATISRSALRSSCAIPLLALALAGCVATPPADSPYAAKGGLAQSDTGLSTFNPSQSTPLMRVAVATARAGDHAAAVGLFRQAHQNSPESILPLLGLGASLANLKAYPASAEAYRNALALNPVNTEARIGLANALIAMDQPALALPHLQAALKVKPEPRIYNALGVVYDKQGKHEEAQAKYRAGLALAPTDAGLKNNLGLSLAFSGQHTEAIAILSSVAAGAGATPRNRQNLALAYGLAGDSEAAARIARVDLDEVSVRRNLAYYATLRARGKAVKTRDAVDVNVSSAPPAVPQEPVAQAPVDEGEPKAMAAAAPASPSNAPEPAPQVAAKEMPSEPAKGEPVALMPEQPAAPEASSMAADAPAEALGTEAPQMAAAMPETPDAPEGAMNSTPEGPQEPAASLPTMPDIPAYDGAAQASAPGMAATPPTPEQPATSLAADAMTPPMPEMAADGQPAANAETADTQGADPTAAQALANEIDREAAKSAEGSVSHVVEKGDTLFNIAKRYNVDRFALARANNITDPTMIHIGDMLIVPTNTANGHAPSQPSGPVHVVVKGDTLFSIARAYKIDRATLAQINHITDPGKIRLGDRLALPDGAVMPAPSDGGEVAALPGPEDQPPTEIAPADPMASPDESGSLMPTEDSAPTESMETIPPDEAAAPAEDAMPSTEEATAPTEEPVGPAEQPDSGMQTAEQPMSLPELPALPDIPDSSDMPDSSPSQDSVPLNEPWPAPVKEN